MARKPTGKPNGRPLTQIDQKHFEEFCELQCTEEEICGVLKITNKTLNEWCKRTYGESFSYVYKNYASGGKISLRRNLNRMSKKNASVAIFLAKNMLGMVDKVENVDDEETKEQLNTITDAIRKIREE